MPDIAYIMGLDYSPRSLGGRAKIHIGQKWTDQKNVQAIIFADF